MDLQRIKYLGEFDKVYTIGYISPSQRSSGIEIVQDKQFSSNLLESDSYRLQTIDTCTIQIIGECNLHDWTQDQVMQSRNSRKLYNIRPLQLGKDGVDRYIIGYLTVLIFDGNKLGMKDALKTVNVTQAAKQQDEIEMFEFLNNYIISLSNKKKTAQVGLLDRMYIAEAFRQNKVGSWILDNLRDLIEFYSKVRLDAIVLEAGDFANEQGSKFNMTREEYVKNLVKFYKKHGFKSVNQGILSVLKLKHEQEIQHYMTLKY